MAGREKLGGHLHDRRCAGNSMIVGRRMFKRRAFLAISGRARRSKRRNIG